MSKPEITGLERRAFAVDAMKIEARDKNARRLVGHAAVFNQEADIGGYFWERIAPGAFSNAIKNDDVRSLFNHDPNFVLGRTRAGTLTLSEDDTGLLTVTDPPDTQFARDLAVSIERGDITQMSFAFRVKKETWEEKGDRWLRTVEDVELFDVSPVTFPAYPTTDVGLRHLDEFRALRAGPALAAAQRARRAAVQRIREKSL